MGKTSTIADFFRRKIGETSRKETNERLIETPDESVGQLQTKVKKMGPEYDSREKYFSEHGGILLEKQLALCRGQNIASRQVRTLSMDEIENATNNYDPSLVLGVVQSIVYKGVIEGRVVAVKAPVDRKRDHHLTGLYLTEAAISMVMNHENLIRIYGFCLETCIPILVHEYLPNGTFYNSLHSNRQRMKWSDRLRVVTDTAYALSYMHNALPRPVVHRDVQPLSILLDESFRAKLSNFGYSVTLTPGETTQISCHLGYQGYIDPEYVVTEKLTEKCDVYSFGVMLLEILTGLSPIVMASYSLVDVFVSAVGSNDMTGLIERGVLEQARDDEIQQVSRLALACVAKKGVERPTMINVVQELWQIQQQNGK